MAIPDHPWTKASRDSAAVRIAMTVAERGERDGELREVVKESGLDTDEPQIVLSQTEAPIHANLATGTNVTALPALQANGGLSSRGVGLFGAGFMIPPNRARDLGLGMRAGIERHLRQYRHGRDLLQAPRGVFVIDLYGLAEKEVRTRFPEIYSHLLTTVKPERDKNPRKTRRENWWLFGEQAPAFRDYSAGLSRYIATVETSKYRIFQFLDAEILPDNKLVAIGLEDGFSLGVLQSKWHVDWSLQAGGWLGVGNDSVYVKSKVFDTFPFPDPTPGERAIVAEMAEELDATRKAALAETDKLTMTELYNIRAKLRRRGDERSGAAAGGEGAGGDRRPASRANRPGGGRRLWLGRGMEGGGSRPVRNRRAAGGAQSRTCG